jgi:O-antigen/teichoic acid export membrane protein
LLVAVSPLLTRLYSPEDFGALAIFMSLTAWLLTISTGRYDQAVMLAEDDNKAVRIAYVALTLAAFSTAVTLVGTLVAVPLLSEGANSPNWMYWLAPMVLVSSVNAVLVAFAIRRGEVKLVASTSAIKGFAIATFQVAMGFWRPSSLAMVGAHTLGSATANFRLTVDFYHVARSSPPSYSEVLATAKEYSRFPKHTMPAALLSATNLNALPPLVGLIFGTTTLGLWSLARRVVAAPLAIVGSAVGQIYYQRATQAARSGRDSLSLLKMTAVRMAVLSAPFFVMLGVVAPQAFEVIFGSEWEEAGYYARVMIPWMWMQFVASPLSRVTLVFGRNRLDIGIQLGLIAVTGVVLAVAWVLAWNFMLFLTVLSGCLAVSYFLLLLIYGKIAGHGGAA